MKVFASCGHDGHQYALYTGKETLQRVKIESRCLRFDWYADGPLPIASGTIYKTGFQITISPYY